MNKQELLKKVRRDLKWDKIMTVFSSLLLALSYIFTIAATWVVFVAALNFLLWLNALLITKRNLQILQLIKEDEQNEA